MNKAPEQSELYKALVSKRPRSAGSLPCSAAMKRNSKPAFTSSLQSAKRSGFSDFERSMPRVDRFEVCDPWTKANPSGRSKKDEQREVIASYFTRPGKEHQSSTALCRERTPISERRENGKIALRACRSSEDWSDRLKSSSPRKFILDSNELSIASVEGHSSSSVDCIGSESPRTLVIVKAEEPCPFEREVSSDGLGSCVVDLAPRPESLQRSVSEDGRCSHDCVPLDLSMSAKRSSVESFAVQNYDLEVSSSNLSSSASLPLDGSVTPSEASIRPKLSLMQLADAVSFLVENDLHSSETFFSSRSSPSSFSDTNSSNSVDEKITISDYRLSDPAVEFLTDSREFSADDSKFIKYEVSDSFQPEGIILNSNVLGDKVFSDEGLYFPSNGMAFCPDSEGAVDQSGPVFGRILQPHGTTQYVQILRENPSGTATKTDSSVTRCRNGGTMIIPNGVDSKRRLRLAKADYESMSEEDRRVRHRRLDNERSKQYRERRRRMVSSLQAEITLLEDKNRSLKNTLETLKVRTSIMRAAVEHTELGCLVGEPQLVSAQC